MAPAARFCPCATAIASDLREVKDATGFEYIRFHAIFHDEVGVYDEDAEGKPVYNFSYVDQIYEVCWKITCGRLSN